MASSDLVILVSALSSPFVVFSFPAKPIYANGYGDTTGEVGCYDDHTEWKRDVYRRATMVPAPFESHFIT